MSNVVVSYINHATGVQIDDAPVVFSSLDLSWEKNIKDHLL